MREEIDSINKKELEEDALYFLQSQALIKENEELCFLLQKFIPMAKDLLLGKTIREEERAECIDGEKESLSLLLEEAQSEEENALFTSCIFAVAILTKEAFLQSGNHSVPEFLQMDFGEMKKHFEAAKKVRSRSLWAKRWASFRE